MRISLIAALLSLLVTAQCLAWGAEGHKITGTIASSYLNEDAAKAVRELLGDMTIADACCWADEMRSNPKYGWVNPLHYINVPRSARTIDLSRDGANGEQVVGAILKYRDIVKDTSKPKAERTEALLLLLHFVGDIHQPLHVSFKEDKGGNMIALKAFGSKSNLHRIWDTDLIRRRLKDTKNGWPVMSADLRQGITEAQRKTWSANLDPVAWANESLKTTHEIYDYLPQTPDDINDAYYARWMPTLNARLQAAGVRMGALLNDALSTPSNAKSGAAKTKPAKASPATTAPAETKPATEKSAPTSPSRAAIA